MGQRRVQRAPRDAAEGRIGLGRPGSQPYAWSMRPLVESQPELSELLTYAEKYGRERAALVVVEAAIASDMQASVLESAGGVDPEGRSPHRLRRICEAWRKETNDLANTAEVSPDPDVMGLLATAPPSVKDAVLDAFDRGVGDERPRVQRQIVGALDTKIAVCPEGDGYAVSAEELALTASNLFDAERTGQGGSLLKDYARYVRESSLPKNAGDELRAMVRAVGVAFDQGRTDTGLARP